MARSAEIDQICLPTEDMKTLLSHAVSVEDTKRYQEMFENEIKLNCVNPQTKFQYAWCLVHNKDYRYVKKGATLFEEVFKEGSEEIKRDSLFYLAVAETKLKNYCTANKYVKAFLSVEPSNIQAQQLDDFIQKQLKKDGVTGMALMGAGALLGGAGAIVIGTLAIGAAVGFALVKRKGK